jgi:hypothetical protein
MRRVRQIDPTHQWAIWHSIVLSYELSDHDAVIELFARIDRSYFADQDKDWRYLKAWEYALCSHLRSGHREIFESGLKNLMQEFVKVADDPDVILERPNQILAIYRELRSGRAGLSPEADRAALVNLIEGQLALLVPGHWVKGEELRADG